MLIKICNLYLQVACWKGMAMSVDWRSHMRIKMGTGCWLEMYHGSKYLYTC